MNRVEMIRGALLSLFCQSIAVSMLMLYHDNSIAGAIAFVFVPTVLMLFVTRRLQFAFAFAFLNDIYSGGSGTWARIGPVSGRWLLVLLFFIVTVMTSRRDGRTRSRLAHRHGIYVVSFGLVLPALLLVRAGFASGIVVDKAIGDVAFLSILLSYYSLREVVAERPGLLLGWLLGASLGLVTILLLMSVGPGEFRSQMVMAVIGDVRYGLTVSGISRVSPVQVVLVFFPFLLAFNTLVLRRLSLSNLLVTVAAALTAVSPLAVIYLRGPLLASGLTVVIMGVIGTSGRTLSKIWKAGVAFLIMVLVVAVTMVIVVPEESEASFNVSQANWFEQWVGARRMYQHRAMLSAAEEDPWLGAGVGTPMASFEGAETTEFEMQYHMLLYRYGFVAFGLFMGAVFWILFEPFRFWRGHLRHTVGPMDVWSLSCLATTIAVLIAGAFNPYLRAPFAPLFLALYFCTKEKIAVKGNRRVRRTLPDLEIVSAHVFATKA